MMESSKRSLDISRLAAIIQEFQKNEIYIKANENCFSRYNFKNEVITPSQILKLALQVQNRKIIRSKRRYTEQTTDGIALWSSGQQKLLCWISICFCNLHKINLNQLNILNIGPIKDIFNDKDPSILVYQIKNMISFYEINKQQWTKEEEEFLTVIMSKENNWTETKINFKWKFISYKLFVANGLKTFRTSRDCRQKWINYLDPTVIKTQWTKEEDIKLIKKVQKYGLRWSILSKKFNYERTQNMVKNRVTALLKKAFKRPPKLLKKTHFEQLQIFINLSESQRNIFLPKRYKRCVRNKNKFKSFHYRQKSIVKQEQKKIEIKENNFDPIINEIEPIFLEDLYSLQQLDYSRVDDRGLIDQILALPQLGRSYHTSFKIQMEQDWIENSLQFSHKCDIF